MLDKSTLAVLLALLLALAGCTGFGVSETQTTVRPTPQATTQQPTTSTPTSTTTILQWPPIPYDPVQGPRAYPEPPQSLNETAVSRAVESYESAYVYNTLSNVDGLQNVEAARRGNSEILQQTHDGVVVEVTLRYSYEQTTESNTTSIYDGTVQTIYFVNTTTIWRVNADQPIKY